MQVIVAFGVDHPATGAGRAGFWKGRRVALLLLFALSAPVFPEPPGNSVTVSDPASGSVPAAPTAILEGLRATLISRWEFQKRFPLASQAFAKELSDAARKHLAEIGFDPLYGARPLARTIQEHVKKPLAEELLFGRLEKGGTVRVDFDPTAKKLTFDIVESKSNPREETVEQVEA